MAACLSAQAEAPRRSLFGRVFGASPLSEESRRWYVGALGELHVAGELDRLGPSWVVLHAVPVGEHGHIIDHLVIGPGGAFAISVVHHQDCAITVRGDLLAVNGVARPYLAASRDEATDAAVSLTRAAGFSVPVRGLLVFVAPHSVSVRDEPDDVGVTSDRALHKWLTSDELALDEDRVEAIAEAAVEPATWGWAASHLRSPAVDPEEFDALRVDIHRAWLARGFWSCALIGAAAVAAFQFFG